MEKQEKVNPLEPRDDQMELLTIQEISAKMKVKPSFFYAPVRRRGPDAIPCIKMGKYLRYHYPTVRAYFEKQNHWRE